MGGSTFEEVINFSTCCHWKLFRSLWFNYVGSQSHTYALRKIFSKQNCEYHMKNIL